MPESSDRLGQICIQGIAGVLVRERSVTRAAVRTGITQSAMSHTLRRLRELFGDPLLVRAGASMVLTPRAEALAVPLRASPLGLERTLAEPDPFEPAVSTRAFRITSPARSRHRRDCLRARETRSE